MTTSYEQLLKVAVHLRDFADALWTEADDAEYSVRKIGVPGFESVAYCEARNELTEIAEDIAAAMRPHVRRLEAFEKLCEAAIECKGDTQ